MFQARSGSTALQLQQVKPYHSTLPYVAKEKYFVLKGDSTINSFIQNFFKLSGDIDLA